MKDKFADLAEPKSRSMILVVVALVLFAAFLVYRWSTADWQPIHGTVESVAPAGVAQTNGAAAGTVSVKLPDGSVVLAQVTGGVPLHAGEQVRLVQQPASATGIAFAVIEGSPRR